MPLIKVSRANLSTSHYSTEEITVCWLSLASLFQETNINREKGTKKRGKRRPHTWMCGFGIPLCLVQASSGGHPLFCRCTLSPTQLPGETSLLETTVNPWEDPGILDLSVALKLPPSCVVQSAPCVWQLRQGVHAQEKGKSSLPFLDAQLLCLSHQLLLSSRLWSTEHVLTGQLLAGQG